MANRSLLSSFFLFVTLVVVVTTRGDEEVVYECVDNLEEYQLSRWYGSPVSPKWATSSENLPEALNGKLNDAEGIFYFDGGHEGTGQNQSFWKKPSDFPDLQPIYVYLRYYTHTPENQKAKMYIMPVRDLVNGPIKYLDPTADFEWREELVEINGNLVEWISISIHADMLESGDYFLLDKVIIVQGAVVSGIDDIKEYCVKKEPPTTSHPGTDPSTTEDPEVTNTTTTTTTQRPSYDCKEPGYFPDKDDCTKFHVCQYDQYGDIWDTLMDCPLGFSQLNWCQEILRCEYPEICPCTIPEYYK